MAMWREFKKKKKNRASFEDVKQGMYIAIGSRFTNTHASTPGAPIKRLHYEFTLCSSRLILSLSFRHVPLTDGHTEKARQKSRHAFHPLLLLSVAGRYIRRTLSLSLFLSFLFSLQPSPPIPSDIVPHVGGCYTPG